MKITTDRQFEDLAAGFITETLSDDEQARFLELVRSSKEYRAKYLAFAESYARSFVPRFERVKMANYRQLIARPELRGLRRMTHRRIIWGRVAAAVLLCATTGLSAYYITKDVRENRRIHADVYELTVPHGSQLSMTLPDDTRVRLNSGSVLRYDRSYGRRERRVSLSGEGYFEVRKDAGRPFVVDAGEIGLSVLGTVFNMRNYNEENTVEVSLIEGSVRLASLGAGAGEPVFLQTNQKASYHKNTGQFSTSSYDAYKSAQWTIGKLSLVNTSIVRIMRDLERHYDIKVIMESRRLAGEYFSGSIDLSLPVEDVFDYLDVEDKYRWEQQGNVFIIKDKN